MTKNKTDTIIKLLNTSIVFFAIVTVSMLLIEFSIEKAYAELRDINTEIAQMDVQLVAVNSKNKENIIASLDENRVIVHDNVFSINE